MKRPLGLPLVLFVLVVSIPSAAQDNLSLGQNLEDYLNAHPPRYMTGGPVVIDMKDGQIDFYKYQQNTTDADIKILVVDKTYPIGVLERVAGEDKILLDMTGNGILDTDFPTLFVPYWVVARSTPDSLKNSRNNVFDYFQAFYKDYQGDTDPTQSGALRRDLDALVSAMYEDNLDNRDLIYGLYCYYRLGPPRPQQCLSVLNYLTINYSKRFDAVHPLLFLHTLESLINGRNMEAARTVMKQLVAMDPAFVPGLVYQWQLEQDPATKKQYYAKLKKDHPNHWIVRQLTP